MTFNILLDLAVEKIRIDFGDFIASLFRIISINNNCFLDQLTKIFSHIPYKTIRVGIIILYQYNLIFLENFESCTNFFGETIRFTKLSVIISEAIYRLRYPRFIALIEYDYGFYGASVIRSVLNSGQLYLSTMIKNFCRQSIEIVKAVEDILIHMARDKLIVQSDAIIKENHYLNSNKNIKYRFECKPTIKSKFSPWKIFTKIFNFRLKMNILFSLLQDYQNFQTKYLIKFYMSKLLTINFPLGCELWFSIDSIVDFCQDGIVDLNLKEKFIISSIENFCFIDQYIELKKFFLKVNINDLLGFFREKFIENLIINQFGKKFGTIFKILTIKKSHEEKELLSKSGFNSFQTKTILYQMHRMGFVFLEDSELSQKTTKNVRFWKLELGLISQKLTICIIKSIYNLLIRLENYNWIIKKLFETENLRYCYIASRKNNAFLEKMRILSFTLFRIDEILNLLYL